jgi:hypothetical protein
VCFQGVDGNDMKSQKKCFSITVLAAVISWAQTTPCPNPVVDAEDVLVCPPDGHHVTITVGCHYTYSLAAVAERYSLHLREQQYPSCDGCALLEPHGHTHNQKTTENLLVTQCSQKSGAEASVACCGNGICDGLETGGACTSDCQLDTASLTQTQVGSNANGWLSRAEYTWTPMWGTEGRRLLKCFEGVTSAGESSSNMLSNLVVDGQRTRTHAPSFCVVFDVQRCSYCIPHKATMKSLSAHYFLNADWLRIYNSNPLVPNPDVLISGVDQVHAGPLYTAQRGDTLLSIAAMAKTTVKTILQVNSDLAVSNSEDLKPGQPICLLLCSAMPVAK